MFYSASLILSQLYSRLESVSRVSLQKPQSQQKVTGYPSKGPATWTPSTISSFKNKIIGAGEKRISLQSFWMLISWYISLLDSRAWNLTQGYIFHPRKLPHLQKQTCKPDVFSHEDVIYSDQSIIFLTEWWTAWSLDLYL